MMETPELTPIADSELIQFSRRYRFVKARLRRIRIDPSPRGSTAELVLTARTAFRDLDDEPRPVSVVLRIDGVEEFRFQKRPMTSLVRIADVKLAAFDGLIFVNLDAMVLSPGDVPGIYDFRASDAYVAGRRLSYRELESKK